MILYSCIVTDCMESWTTSLHKTKKGAWKAGNRWLNDRHNQSYESRACLGKWARDFIVEGLYSFNVVPIKVEE